MKKLFVFLMLGIFLVNLASAYEVSYYFKQGQPAFLEVPCDDTNNNPCPETTICEATIDRIGGTNLYKNQSMTYNYDTFRLNLSEDDNALKGFYQSVVHCYGPTNGSSKFIYEVNGSGKPDPSGAVIIFFIAGFMVIVALLFLFMLYPIFYFIELGEKWESESKPVFDLKDFIYNVSGYLLLIVFYMFAKEYMANDIINRIMSTSIWVTTFTNFISSIVAFVLSFGVVGWSGILQAMKGVGQDGQG